MFVVESQLCLWLHHVFLLLHHGFVMVASWFCHGCTIVLSWLHHGLVMVALWFCYGCTISLFLLRNSFVRVAPQLCYNCKLLQHSCTIVAICCIIVAQYLQLLQIFGHFLHNYCTMFALQSLCSQILNAKLLHHSNNKVAPQLQHGCTIFKKTNIWLQCLELSFQSTDS